MLIVIITSYQEKPQTCTLRVDTLEEGIDWINALIATGEHLLSIHVVDAHSNIMLPVDAFDGQPMTTALQALEQQWQEIIPPGPNPASHLPRQKKVRSRLIRDRIELTQKRLQLSERQIESVTGSIGRLQVLLDRAVCQPGASALSSHYNTLLARFRKMLDRYRQDRLVILSKLGQLQSVLNEPGDVVD